MQVEFAHFRVVIDRLGGRLDRAVAEDRGGGRRPLSGDRPRPRCVVAPGGRGAPPFFPCRPLGALVVVSVWAVACPPP
eukprot:scaffold103719_cov46-Phaeocystis_antarctica.AAC.1